MSQIIIIDSSDDENSDPVKTESNTELNPPPIAKSTELENYETIFKEFCELCSYVIKSDVEGKKILDFLRSKHGQAAEEHKSSRSYRKVLQRCVSRLKDGSKDVYVHVNNVISTLDKNNISSNNNTSGQKRIYAKESEVKLHKKRKLITTHVPVLPVNLSSITQNVASEEPLIKVSPQQDTGEHLGPNENKQTEASNENTEIHTAPDDQPTSSFYTSSKSMHSDGETNRELRRRKKIKNLETLLKRISSEIIRLQSQELTLDDMDKEDTSYIQESKLKKRFMDIHKELCRLNGTNTFTGRVIEQKIKITSSRFKEINRKIELYINNPKRAVGLPDFEDVCYLVRQASIRNNLALSKAITESIAHDVFQEIGDKWQKRRQRDFAFEFGCSAIDSSKDISDPATTDTELNRKLSENRAVSRKNLESVIQKYSSIQHEMGEREPENPALQEDNEEESEDEDSGSDIEIIPQTETNPNSNNSLPNDTVIDSTTAGLI